MMSSSASNSGCYDIRPVFLVHIPVNKDGILELFRSGYSKL